MFDVVVAVGKTRNEAVKALQTEAVARRGAMRPALLDKVFRGSCKHAGRKGVEQTSGASMISMRGDIVNWVRRLPRATYIRTSVRVGN